MTTAPTPTKSTTDSSWLPVSQALKAAPGANVTVKGWVRTRRDSKAEGGLSFIALHDGTCFDTIQIVAKGDLPNYASEVAKLVTGASLECEGTIVTNPKGGAEIAATAIRVDGAESARWRASNKRAAASTTSPDADSVSFPATAPKPISHSSSAASTASSRKALRGA